MYKEIKFDVVGAISTTRKYDAEWEAIHAFNGSEHKNMVLSYDNEKDARNAYIAVQKIIRTEKISVSVSVYKKTNVIVTK